MSDFKILHWSGSFDGPWSEDAERRYREGGFDGISITANSTEPLADLELLSALHGLRYLSVRARVRNDLAAFRVPTLQGLSLATGCKLRLPEVIQPSLRDLVLTDRPGLEIDAHWPSLSSLRIGQWRGSNFQFLGNSRNLARLYVEGRKQRGDLGGIENCGSLAELISVNYPIRDTAPLRDLEMLSEVRLMTAPPASPHGQIDIADLSGPYLQRMWVSNAPELLNLEALLECPRLLELRFVKCRLSDSDRRLLGSLPARVKVTII